MNFRRATVADLPELAAIAMAAKASWGYSPALLELWRGELELTPGQLTTLTVVVATDDERILGFAAVAMLADAAELEHLWVAPAAMGKGVGRALVHEACAAAALAGLDSMLVDSDPHAAPFYLRLGAIPIGTCPAPIPEAPDRVLPRFQLKVGTAACGAASMEA